MGLVWVSRDVVGLVWVSKDGVGLVWNIEVGWVGDRVGMG